MISEPTTGCPSPAAHRASPKRRRLLRAGPVSHQHKFFGLPPSHLVRPKRVDSESVRKLHDWTLDDDNHKAPRLDSQHLCGRGTIVGQNPERSHVVIVPMRCKSWDCKYCGPFKRRAWIHKLESGKPQRELTLTLAPNPNKTPKDLATDLKNSFRKLVAAIRRRFGPFEYALVFELTKKGVPHAHVLFRGAYIPKKWLSLQWVRLGHGPVVYIQSVTNHRLHSAHACKYLGKGVGQTAFALAPLRIVQCSAGYLPSHATDDPVVRNPGHIWVYTPSSPSDVAERFCASDRYLDLQHRDDGSIEVWLSPSPVTREALDAPFLWVTGTDADAAYGPAPPRPRNSHPNTDAPFDKAAFLDRHGAQRFLQPSEHATSAALGSPALFS